ncbi:putative bifunctional diguanylate cyclase/phosphodiesterase [Aurantimonas coralicida]|uniref:putative bifunctional diguanylate cyclase/phosphodiesterase n=1 Tax=Aurantimonas coralicida TaxID=182270 RepID=UPI0023F5777F|nr:EAL domain-containing protein [Aurantimonas coralicida]
MHSRQIIPARGGLLDAAFSRLAVPVLVLDEDGTVVAASAGAVAVLGKHVIGDDVGSLLLANAAGDFSTADPAPHDWIRTVIGSVLPARIEPLGEAGFLLTIDPELAQTILEERQVPDDLTGLPRRKELLTRLSTALENARRDELQVAVHCLDLDRFKIVNDTLGHPIGDALLKKVVQRMQSACRKSDLIARVGGDEFVIVQEGIQTVEAAEALAKRLVDLVGRTYVLRGHTVNIGVSIGVMLSDGESDPDTLMRSGDLALYQAKSAGRGCFAVFEPSMDMAMQERRSLEIDLRRALALREFELDYQPQIDLLSDCPVGFEALLRWNHPKRGRVSPLAFIPLAEETGLITPIGEWVIRTACHEASSWPGDISIAINISAVQFRGGGLVETVLSALSQSGLKPELLELEITESSLIDNTEMVLSTLRQLKEIGVRISMDDFGTGYSSLSYLQKFPFDKIKIDQSFVRGADESSNSRALLKAIASIGASLGMKTTAEGVETEDQLARIRNEGCTQVQGYLTGRPMGAGAINSFLDKKLTKDLCA